MSTEKRRELRTRIAGLRIQLDFLDAEAEGIRKDQDRLAKELEALVLECAAVGVDVTVVQPMERRPLKMTMVDA